MASGVGVGKATLSLKAFFFPIWLSAELRVGKAQHAGRTERRWEWDAIPGSSLGSHQPWDITTSAATCNAHAAGAEG